jgi:manganese/zinc/iron transport system substrate-binding protein
MRSRRDVLHSILVTLLSAGAVAATLACNDEATTGNGGPAAAAKPLRVVSTTTMIDDLVKSVGGDRVSAAVIMPPGTDPHTYKPSPGDVAELRGADLIFYNGLHLEGTMVDLFEDPKKLGGKSVAVTSKLPEEALLGWKGSGGGGAHDPHVWFDVTIWSRAAEVVADTLAERDATHAAEYRTRAAELAKRLATLDAYVRGQLAGVPKERRVLITSHDAYNYFGKAYGVEVRGLQGISTESEAGIQAVNSAVDYIITAKIPAIFVESSVSPKTIQRVQSDCQARGFPVKIGGELYSDAMGRPGERPGYAVETYEGMVRYNVDTIVKALRN